MRKTWENTDVFITVRYDDFCFADQTLRSHPYFCVVSVSAKHVFAAADVAAAASKRGKGGDRPTLLRPGLCQPRQSVCGRLSLSSQPTLCPVKMKTFRRPRDTAHTAAKRKR